MASASAPASAPLPSPAPAASASVVDGGAPVVDPAFARLPASLPVDLTSSTKPEPVKREGKAWPFHKWDRAEAVVLNWQPYGKGTVLRAYDDRGWTPKLAYRTSLDAAAAKRAVDLVLEAKGELEVSKCAVPRHAVVLFDGDTPIASINVCFTCHDILLWPAPRDPAPPDPDRRAEKVLPRWEKLFAGELHFPLWPKDQP